MIQQNISSTLPTSALFYKLVQSTLFAIVLILIAVFFPPVSVYSGAIKALVVLVLGIGGMVYSYLYWSTFSYTAAAESLAVNSGVLFRSSKVINFNDLQSENVVRGPLLMAFGLGRLQGFTSSPQQLVISSTGQGGTTTTVRPDVDLIISKDDADQLIQMMRNGHIQKVENVQAVQI